MKAEITEKRCWNPKCKRIIVGDSKLGLCDTCFNKYGSRAVFGLVIAGGALWKNKGKIASGAISMIKHVKP